jgi:hypothetical protein
VEPPGEWQLNQVYFATAWTALHWYRFKHLEKDSLTFYFYLYHF